MLSRSMDASVGTSSGVSTPSQSGGMAAGNMNNLNNNANSVGSPTNLPSTPVREGSSLSKLILSELTKHDYTSSTLKLIGMNIAMITDADVELLHNVERLSLRRNRLLSLPYKFSSAKSLRYLDLHGNMFRDIPSVLMQCPQLEILDLSANNIETLPRDISPLWAKNLKVLSLKNNNLTSIRDLTSIVKLENLSVLEIENNLIPKEELELVTTYTPLTKNLQEEEYYALAIRRYLQDHPQISSQENTKIKRAAKRMGFINSLSPANSTIEETTEYNHLSSSSSSSVNNIELDPTSSSSVKHSETDGANPNEFYSRTKYDDYFKRLSVLPEETLVSTEITIGHEDIVLACRKLLFSFTECQQNIRRITSFCKEKSIAVDVVSLLYSVRSHIDDLVEVLEKSENEGQSHDKALVKLCITIIENFKQIISLLLKNFKIFFEADDLCFIRMFYTTLLISYNEIYNAWCFISPENVEPTKKPNPISRAHTSLNIYSSISPSSSDATAKHLSRTRSNTLQARVAPSGLNSSSTPVISLPINSVPVSSISTGTNSPGLTMTTPTSSFWGMNNASTPRMTPGLVSNVSQLSIGDRNLDNHIRQPSPRIRTNSNDLRQTEVPKTETDALNSNIHSTTKSTSPPSNTIPNTLSKTVSNNSVHSSLAPISPNLSISIPPIAPAPTTASLADKDIDVQLYQTLFTVVKMVSVVYDQLTAAMSKTAIARTTGQQEITESLTNKIHDLTETCRQSMELSKILNERLRLLTFGDESTTSKYLTNSEKLRTWENINAFLKSIISILGNTKVVMAEMPILNEIRPNLASLAKITKDVTVILDLSSYKAVSVASTTQGQSNSQQTEEIKDKKIHTGNTEQLNGATLFE